ncbi:MAG: hypothetical protein ACMXYD_02205 [Candidatus Woesearchaeota archaeon]
MQEVELKFIEINKEEMISRIEALGANKKYSHTLQSTMFGAKGYCINSSIDKPYLRVRQIGVICSLRIGKEEQSICCYYLVINLRIFI